MDKKPFPQSPDEPMQGGRVALLSAAHFVNDTYPGFVAPLLPLLMDKIGFGLTLAAVLTSIMAVFNSLAQPLFGHLADRMKTPYFTIFGPLVTAVFLGSIGLWHSYAALIVILVISGLGTSAFHPQTAVLTGVAGGNRKGLAMSIFVTGGSAGHSLGPIIIIPIVTYLGLKYSGLTIAYGLLMSFLLFRYLPNLPRSPMHTTHIGMSNQSPRRLLMLGLLWFIVTVRAFMVVGLITFIPIYLHNKELSLFLSGSAITVFEMFGALGSLMGGAMSDRYGRKLIIVISFVGALPCLWAFLHFTGFVAFLFLAMGGLILYSSISVTIIMAQELFPARVNTVSSLVMGMAWGIGGLLVTPLGALAEKTGIVPALDLLLGLGVFAVFAAFVLPETRGIRSKES
ncbi:MAG: MFS transporter [Calditrichaeota bacterium]|nr:MFS transporter [Calditrichota bacterium]